MTSERDHRPNPFRVDKILEAAFAESQGTLRHMAMGSYYWMIYKSRQNKLVMSPRTNTQDDLDNVYEALNHVLFDYYYLTERRFLELIDRAMHTIQVLKSEAFEGYLRKIKYINSEEPGETAELYSTTETELVQAFMSDFQEELEFQKMLAKEGEIEFREFREFVVGLKDGASTTYDPDKAEVLRGSSTLGTLLRLIAGVSKAEGLHVNPDLHAVFPHYKFTCNFPRQIEYFRPTFKTTIKDQRNLPAGFLATMSLHEMKFREALFLDGYDTVAFKTFLEYTERRRLDGNIITHPADRKNFGARPLRAAVRDWLLNNATMIRVKEYISVNHDSSTLKSSDNTTQVNSNNIEIVFRKAQQYNRSIAEQRKRSGFQVQGYQPNLSPTSSEIFAITGEKTAAPWGTDDPPMRKVPGSSSSNESTGSGALPVFVGFGILAYIAMTSF